MVFQPRRGSAFVTESCYLEFVLKDNWTRDLGQRLPRVEYARQRCERPRRIKPEDKTRTEVLSVRVDLYSAARKWDMVAAVASHLVKVEPEEAGWWINLAYATRRCESIEKAETILLRARELHHENALIEFNLACYASVTGRIQQARDLLRRAIELEKEIRRPALDDDDLKPLWDWIVASTSSCLCDNPKRP